jgi:Flp pilus assembly protein TadG
MLRGLGTDMHPPMNRLRTRLRLARARRAVAVMEFGLLAPVMALLVVGVFDISKVAILWEQVWNASRSIAESASTLAIPVSPGGANQLTWQNADVALSATYAEIPWLAAGIATGNYTATGTLQGNPMVAVLSSVDYEPPVNCQSNCTYTPTVQWSKAYVHTGFDSSAGRLRPCGSTLIQQAPGTPVTPQTIDTQTVGSTMATAGITVPDPFFVADVRLTYTPYFFNFLTGPVTLSATSYTPVRISNPGTTTGTYAGLLDQGDPDANGGSVCIVTNATG